MFAWGKIAFRRVDRVTPAFLEVDGAKLPRQLVKEAQQGQWLRFTKGEQGVVDVRVDARATNEGEARLKDLFQRLK
jgi:hypothetical protein